MADSPFGGRRREPVKVEPGSDLHFTLLMSPHHLNLIVGQDRQRLLAFARDVWAASQKRASGVPGDERQPPLPRDLDQNLPRSQGVAAGVNASAPDDLRQQAERVCHYLGNAYDGEPRRVIEALVQRAYGVKGSDGQTK